MNRSWTLYDSGVPLNYDRRLGQLGVAAPRFELPFSQFPNQSPESVALGADPTPEAFAGAGRAFSGGLADTAQQTLNLGAELVDYGAERLMGKPLGALDAVRDIIPKIETIGTAEDIGRGIVNVVSSIMLTRGIGIRGAVKNGAMVDALMDPEEGNLATLAKELGFQGELLDFMDSKVEESAGAGERLQARLQNILEGAGVGGLLSTMFRGFKEIKNDPVSAARVTAGLLAGDMLLSGSDEAQAGMIDKVARKGKGVITKLGKAEGETATQFVERMNVEAPIVADAEQFVKLYGDVPLTDAATPSPAVALRQAPAGTRDIVPDLPMGQLGEAPTAASSFAQVGGYFDSLVRMKNGGQPRMWSNPAHQAEILNESASEIAYQMTLTRPGAKDITRKTGWGWYDEDIAKTFNTAAKTMPELAMQAKRGLAIPWEGGPNMVGNTDRVTPTQARILASAVGAPQSFGNPASRNADIQFQAYEVFRKTGQFPEKGIYLDDAGAVESTGKYWTQRAVSEQYIGVVNTLIREIGPAKAADWLVSEHTIAELRDLKRRAVNAAGEPIFKGDGTMGISGKADEIKQGAFIFGPKGGQFMGNLLGFPGTTTDMWFSRTWNRYMGTSREGIGALSETGLVEQPRNLTERGEMADFSKKLTDQLNLDTAFVQRMGRPMTERDTQAVLWYFEQNLYNDMGIRVKPTSFGEGADAYAKRAKTQGGTGIQRRAGNGSAGSATPPNAAAP
jgi:hypothetical protein